MRILVLTNIFPPHHYGGYELACEWVVNRWRAQGHQVEVVTGDHRRDGVEDRPEPNVTRGLRFYWRDHALVSPGIRRRFAWERHNRRLLGAVLDRLQPEVLSVWNHGTMSYGLLTSAQERGIPMALVVADDWLCWGPAYDRWTSIFEHRGAPGRAVGTAVARLTGVPTRWPDLAERTVVLWASTWLRDRAATSSPFRFRRQAVVPWGIDLERFPLTPPRERDFGWRLVLVGRVEERKGTFTAVRALEFLPDRATLDIVGPATPEDRRRLDSLVAELGLGERVRVIEVEPSQVREHYVAADVALFPSEWGEPFGLVGLEAMACGTPLVATGTGGSADYLRDGSNALLVPVGDPARIASAVRRLAEDPPLRRGLVEAGRSTAEAHSAATMADRLLGHHEELVATGATVARRADRP